MKKKIRLTAAFAAVVLIPIVCALALVSWDVLHQATDLLPAQKTGDSSYLVTNEINENIPVCTVLRPMDIAFVVQSNESIQAMTQFYMESEESRRELAACQAKERLEFLQERAALMTQQIELQEQLDTKAQADIAAMGGVDATSEDVVVAPDIKDEPQSSLYLGQFQANVVCTCASCLNNSEWPEVSVGDRYILADPEYIKPGIEVTMDQGLSGSYSVVDAKGKVLGRSIVVFDNNHNEAGGGQHLYPKITEKK